MDTLVKYPKIKGATPIRGWVSQKKVRVNLEVGAEITLDFETAKDLGITFPFLKVKQFSELNKDEQKKIVKKKEIVVKKLETAKEKVKSLKEIDSDEVTKEKSKGLKKQAVELGVYEVGMNGGQLRKAIKDAETKTN